jgi:hypothetical protein
VRRFSGAVPTFKLDRGTSNKFDLEAGENSPQWFVLGCIRGGVSVQGLLEPFFAAIHLQIAGASVLANTLQTLFAMMSF